MSSSPQFPVTRKPGANEFKGSYRIIVIGAGLVGLVVAALLQKSGFRTIVLERDEKLQTVRLLSESADGLFLTNRIT